MRKEVESLERRILKWLFAPGAWVVTATLLLFSALVVYYLPMTADEKFGAIRGVVLVLAVLHFFVARCEVLRFLLDFLLSVILFIPLYFLSVVLFIAACHVFWGRRQIRFGFSSRRGLPRLAIWGSARGWLAGMQARTHLP